MSISEDAVLKKRIGAVKRKNASIWKDSDTPFSAKRIKVETIEPLEEDGKVTIIGGGGGATADTRNIVLSFNSGTVIPPTGDLNTTITRIGDTVTLRLPLIVSGSIAPGTAITSDGFPIPVDLRIPNPGSHYYSKILLNAGAEVNGLVDIQGSGRISIRLLNNAPFGVGGFTGLPTCYVSWHV